MTRARGVARAPWRARPPEGGRRARKVAVGDPQAPLSTFFAVLDRHGLLGDDGWLAPDVLLVSIGDHFDWGGSESRLEAAADGLALLAWLAAHPEDRVVLIAGNHDLARVGELAPFDDATFASVHERAVAAYRGGATDRDLERALCEAHPSLPTAEVAARDFAAFCVAQRHLVWALLRGRRLRLAFADDRLLFCHAGTTRDHLLAIGLPAAAHADAHAVARAMNEALDAAVARYERGALAIEHLHRPGSWAAGEGGGTLYHRAAYPGPSASPDRPIDLLSRRFDPRRLPIGLTQVIGHVRDGKCRDLLGPWVVDEPGPRGELRHLTTDGADVAYRGGAPDVPVRADAAQLVFIDGGMNYTPADRYAVFEW